MPFLQIYLSSLVVVELVHGPDDVVLENLCILRKLITRAREKLGLNFAYI